MKEATRKKLLKLVTDNFRNPLAQQRSERSDDAWPLATEVATRAAATEQELKILELGCGSGVFSQGLPQIGISYLGLDNCAELIAQAQEASSQDSHRRFAVADLLRLSEVVEIGFDYVIAINLLHHIPSAKLRLEALKQLKNKAKSGAKIYLQVANLRDDKKMRAQLIKFMILKLIGKHDMDWGDLMIDSRDEQGKLLGQIYYHAFSLKELKKLAEQADLQILSLDKDIDSLRIVLMR